MTKHSNIVGGSNAGIVLNCAAYLKMIQALPPSADKPSEYAEEGTAMHAVMSMLMEARMNSQDPLGSAAIAQAMLGATAYDRELTREHLDTMILPALDALEDLEDAYGGGFRVAAVEMGVKFPGVAGAFGTCDLVLVNDTHAIICDWKFGQGVPVAALYEDEAGELLNSQLMFYLAGAMARHRLFVRRKLVIAIIQPRTTEPLTHTEVTRKDVRMFREDIERAVVMAMNRDPQPRKGEWCRWAPCKVICPLWTAPIVGLAEAIGDRVATTRTELQTPDDYGVYLAKAKTFVDLLAMYQKEVNDQLHSYLEAGGVVPGWRLKWKARQRQWIDESIVRRELEQLGFEAEEIVAPPKLVTFAAAEATAKKLGVNIPNHLRVAPESTETTIAPTSDPAPVVDRQLAQAEFSTALKRLT